MMRDSGLAADFFNCGGRRTGLTGAALLPPSLRVDVARSSSITPPERYFTAAQAKIKSGDYNFTVDLPTTR
jgi:hypothetical protein